MYLPGTVQERIRDLYTNTGLTQKEFADKIGIEPSQLSRIGTGRTQRVSSDILIKLAKSLHVSTDYILGLTTIPTPKSYDIGELGLSADAVKNILALKNEISVFNRLLTHRNFPLLVRQIKSYFHDETALGVMGRNALFDAATAMMNEQWKAHPEDNAEIRDDIRFVNAEKFGKHELDMEKIKTMFLAILRDIKREIDENTEQNDVATSELIQKVVNEMANLPPDKRTPEDAANALMQVVSTAAPLDSSDAELFRQLAANLFQNFGVENADASNGPDDSLDK